MKKNEVKKCKVCREEATCSFTSLVTTVGDKPRVQMSTKATHLCSRCIRVWAMTTRPEVGQPVIDAIEALTRRSVRMAADIKPEELLILGVDYAFGSDKTVQRPMLVPRKKAATKKPDGIRVRFSFKERDVLKDALANEIASATDEEMTSEIIADDVNEMRGVLAKLSR